MILFSFATEIGKREKNEDAFGHYKDELFLVADGLGGLPHGEVASKLAVRTVLKTYQENKDIKKAFEEANSKVYRETQKRPEYGGMATTLVGVMFEKDQAVFANVGDSRGYLLRNLRLSQITHDHEDFLGAITQVIGYLPKVQVDIFKIGFKKSDVLLLCTDGLTDTLFYEQIFTILKDTGSSQNELSKKTQELVNTVLDVGGDDNITMCLIKVI